jgi:putative transposase
LGLELRTWGGKREGAGRKPKADEAGVSHDLRPAVKARLPVHVTMRMEKSVWSLTSPACVSALERAFQAGASRSGFKLVQYGVQSDQLQLLVEAKDRRALSNGMNGLAVRVARGLNRVMKRKGKVFADRYQVDILRTRTEVERVRDALTAESRSA